MFEDPGRLFCLTYEVTQVLLVAAAAEYSMSSS